MRKKQVVSVILICAILAALTALLPGQKSTKGTLSSFSATFLKVGKADAIILECEGMTMVITTLRGIQMIGVTRRITMIKRIRIIGVMRMIR